MDKIKILIASKIHNSAISWLEKRFEVVCAFNASVDILKKSIKGSTILIFRSGVQITRNVMECALDLRLLLRAGSGTDNLDLNYLDEHKELKLIRIPQPGARAVAEMSFALMLSLSRSIIEADRLTRQGKWAKSILEGFLLRGKVLGIIGTGNIGATVGQLGSLWGMKVIGCVERESHPTDIDLEEYGITPASFEEVLSQSDYLSIHVPLKSNTRSLIDENELSLMKPGAYLINLARGGVVNESALLKALTKENGLRGAALDVHEKEGDNKISPLAKLENVILTPHIGANTIDTQYEIGQKIIEYIKSFVKNN
jgi:D-3-phosphoglycerate dehydrogenase / 2-oxoglutarate reductase